MRWCVLVMLSVACGRGRAPARDAAVRVAEAGVGVEEAMPAQRPALEPAPEADVRAVVRGIETVAWRLWPAVRARPGNRVFSPVSVSVALAMTEALGRGEGAAEVREALGHGLDEERFHRAMGTLLRAAPMVSAERVFVAENLGVAREVDERLRAAYGAPIGRVNTGAPEAAQRRLAGFVEGRTRGEVREVVPSMAVVAEAPAVVVAGASMRFRCAGATASTMRFNVGGVSPVDAPSVRCRGGVMRGVYDGFVLLRLAGEETALDVLLPDEGRRLQEVEATLDETAMRRAIEGLAATDVEVELPVVRVANDQGEGLRNALMAEGMGRLFDPERSDLRMSGRETSWVSELFQRASVAVESGEAEDGGAAGARVVASRPFVFVLRGSRTGVALAMGRVSTAAE